MSQLTWRDRVAVAQAALDRGAWPEAYRAFSALVLEQPLDRAIQCGLSAAALQMGALEEALLAGEMAVALDGTSVEARTRFANALVRAGRTGEAVVQAQEAARLQPTNRAVIGTLARTLERDNQPDAAVALYDRVLSAGDDPLVRYNRGVTRLVLGDMPGAWADYEARWETPIYQAWRSKWPTGVPKWDGRPLTRGVLALYGEQGAGDVIMFARFAAMVADRAPRTCLLAPAALHTLLEGQCGAVELRDIKDPSSWADVTAVAPLASLPAVLEADVSMIRAAAGVPGWLRAPLMACRDSIAALPRDGGPVVGVSWAGNPQHPFDHLRSLPRAALAQLLDIADVTWVSLQVDARAADLQVCTGGDRVVIPQGITTFADTAAACAACDVVITVDSAVAHVAGSLGVPTHILLPWTPDWRWQLGRADSPWYPSVTLHRQPTSGDWTSVISSVATVLTRAGART